MPSDPLSQVFALLNVRSASSSRLEVGGAWALQFPSKPLLKFHAVLRGSCWITLDEQPPRFLQAGDTFLLANAPTFVLSSDLNQQPEEAARLFGKVDSNIYQYGGDEIIIIGGSFVFEEYARHLLIERLPAFMLIPSGEVITPILHATLKSLDAELIGSRMGSSLMINRLSDILLVQALRAYSELSNPSELGWLGALNDHHIGTALSLMHRNTNQNWKVADLATAVGMSRSGFAARFKELVGIPPLEYLLRWRMQLARDALRQGRVSVASLAMLNGYSSESAFSNAFKRVFGRSPKKYWIGK